MKKWVVAIGILWASAVLLQDKFELLDEKKDLVLFKK